MFIKHARKAASVFGMAVALALSFLTWAWQMTRAIPPSEVAQPGIRPGAVSFEPAGTDDSVYAVANWPVTTGDRIWSDTDGRVELQLDASIIRLAQDGFFFSRPGRQRHADSPDRRQPAGAVRQLDETKRTEIDTPNLAFTDEQPRHFLPIIVDESGDSTEIKVRRGEGQVTGGGAAYTVREHDDALFSGTDQLNADVQDDSGENDDFNNWRASRDRHEEHSESARYVSADVVGYEDLDDHGSWSDNPEYGHVWYPQVEAGWAPYHYGHWAYIEPWGYTWVMISRGVLLRSITAAGHTSEAAGDGFLQDRAFKAWLMCGRFTRPRWWPLWAAVDLRRRSRGWRRRSGGLVPWDRARFIAVVPRERTIRGARERFQYEGEHHHCEQLLPHDGDQQYARDECDVCEPACSGQW